MFSRFFTFNENEKDTGIFTSPGLLYSDEKGCGFYTEELRSRSEVFTYPEINTGFEPYYWYTGTNITHISSYNSGVTIKDQNDDEGMIPLSFKIKVPSSGNYKVTVTIKNDNAPVSNLSVFTGRRRLMAYQPILEAGGVYTFTGICNVCDIVPRNQTKGFHDDTIDVTITASQPKLTSIEVVFLGDECPTIYIAGDSTVTDQSTSYPYAPEKSYSGWAQMFPYYFFGKYGISNHSHSGLTTASFRSEGHYDIIKNNIKKGDYVLFQFGHNDQKLPELKAFGGYADNLRQYIGEVRSYGAFPVIVTPLGRNTWKGIDNSYNDLLADHAKACIAVGEEMDVPVIDLHKESIEFIKAHGLEDSKRYFFLNDYTHTNDYGAYVMAGIVAKECVRLNLPFASDIKSEVCDSYNPPKKVLAACPPEGLENVAAPEAISAFTPDFKDIDNCEVKDAINSLARQGIIPCDENFRPKQIITRVEALSFVIKAVNFVPVNVYNDMYTDVIGHEWYAGTVESAYTNGIVDQALIDGDKFLPNSQVSGEMMVSFFINCLRSRKSFDFENSNFDSDISCSDWAKPYIYTALKLGIIDNSFDCTKMMSRELAALLTWNLREMI